MEDDTKPRTREGSKKTGIKDIPRITIHAKATIVPNRLRTEKGRGEDFLPMG